MPAQLGDAPGGGRVVPHAGVLVAAAVEQDQAEELHRGRRGEDVEVVQAGVHVEDVAGGDEGGGRAVGRQEGAHLVGGGGVVDHDEDAPVLLGVGGQYGAVQPGAVLELGRYVLGGQAEGAQEPVEGLLGRYAALGVVAEQVDEQHAAGEPAGLPAGAVGDLQGELGLADAGEAGECGDEGGAAGSGPGAGAGAARGEGLQKESDVVVAAGEGGGGGRQAGEGGGDLRREVDGDVPALDHGVEKDATADVVGDRRFVRSVLVHARPPVGTGARSCRTTLREEQRFRQASGTRGGPWRRGATLGGRHGRRCPPWLSGADETTVRTGTGRCRPGAHWGFCCCA